MTARQFLLTFFVVCLGLTASQTNLSTPQILAQTGVTVTLQVSDTLVTFNGWTAPSSIVTILQGGSIVATATANQDGFFSKTLLAQVEGVQTFQLYATHISSGQSSSLLEYSLYIPPKTETTVSNIVLPAIATLSSTQIFPNQILWVTGWAAPGSGVSLNLGSLLLPSIIVSETGNWAYPVSGLSLTPGTVYPVTVELVTNGNSSQPSTIGTVTVGFLTLPTTSPSPTSAPASPVDSSPDTPDSILLFSTPGLDQPTPTPIATLPAFLTVFDISATNILSSEELNDIVKIWWEATWPVEQNLSVCDLNTDNRCDIIDFSILMYWIDQHPASAKL